MIDDSAQTNARLPLRTELFLIAHDAETGEPHINEEVLAIGLAGAVLLELWLSGHVEIEQATDAVTNPRAPGPGAVTTVRSEPVGDPILSSAVAMIRHTGPVRLWLHQFAAADLYERVRVDMVTAGVLRRVSRRRVLGLFTTETYIPADPEWGRRVRGRLGSIVQGHQAAQAEGAVDDQCVCLCGLVAALELAPSLRHPSIPTARLRRLLRHIVNSYDHHSIIGEIVAAVEAGRGDYGMAALR